MLNPTMNSVSITTVDGGYLIEWFDLVEIDWSKVSAHGAPALPSEGVMYPRYRRASRQAVREHLDEAMQLVKDLIDKKAKMKDKDQGEPDGHGTCSGDGPW